MKTQCVDRIRSKGKGWMLSHGVLAAAICLVTVAALPLSAQEKQDSVSVGPGNGDSIGFVASARANAKEVGLPLYPGARPHKEKSDDSPAVQLGLWGHTWGFKLAVLKLESNDPPEKIASFYRKALRTYGKVLDCGDSAKAEEDQDKAASKQALGCQDDHPESGDTLLKAGTKERQHIVSVKPEGNLSVFELVYLETPPSDEKN
jgi:hypothetical protein